MATYTIRTGALNKWLDLRTHAFWCPDKGGYVRHGNADGLQVCERLLDRGEALVANSDTLKTVIDRELSRRRRFNAREAAL